MKKWTVLAGLGLIALGSFAFLNASMAAMFNWPVGFFPFWPIVMGAGGIFLTVMPFMYPERRGLSALFIPGFFLMTMSAMLTWSSLFNLWGMWEYFWPMLLISTAAGFLAAGVRMRNVWFSIPAILIGMNGLVMQFAAVTGLWEWWSVLWTVEPFAVGLALFVPGMLRENRGLKRAGTIMMMIGVGAFALMTMIMAGAVGFVGAGLLILAGLALMATAVVNRRQLSAETDPVTKVVSAGAASDIVLSADDIVLEKKVGEYA